MPIGPTLEDSTDLTVAVHLGGPAELRPVPPRRTVTTSNNVYRQRIRAFIEGLQLARTGDAPARGLIDIAFASMQVMQDTIARLKLAACAPDVTVEIPRNACSFHEFWRAEEMIALGRERAAQAFGSSGR